MKSLKIIAICLSCMVIFAGCSKISFLNKNNAASAGISEDSNQDQIITSPASKTGLPLFTIKIPAGWKVTKLTADSQVGTGREMEFSKGSYKIRFAEPQEGTICVLPGQPEFQGPSSSFDQVEEVVIPTGPIVMGRSTVAGDNQVKYFASCSPEKGQTQGTTVYLGSGTSVGSITYIVPNDYDQATIKEMNTILQSIALTK